MATLKELQEKRNKHAAEIRSFGDKFNAEKKWPDEQSRKDYEAANAAYDAVMGEMRSLQAAEDVEKRLNALRDDDERSTRNSSGIPGREDTPARQTRDEKRAQSYERTQELRSLAMAGWCRNQFGIDLTREMRNACKEVGLNPNRRVLDIKLPNTRQVQDLQRAYRCYHPSIAQDRIQESRAMSAVTYATGGGLVSDTFLRTLEVNMLAFGGMRQVSDQILTSSGEDLVWPTADDTSNTGQQLGESTSVGSSVEPSIGGVTWGAYKFSSKPVLVPYELLEDSVFPVDQMLSQMLGERLARITNTKYTTGSGANTPRGIVTAASAGVTAASATQIAADEILGLIHSVDPAYRPGSGFMMHDNVILHLRKLKNGNGDYMWQNGMREGVPDRLEGYSLTINQDMASSVATGAKTMLFGQLSKYKIRRVNSLRLYRLQERYRDTDQDGFIAFIREDGNLLNAGTAPVKYLVQA